MANEVRRLSFPQSITPPRACWVILHDGLVRKIYKLICWCCKSILQQSGNNSCTNKREGLWKNTPFLNFQLADSRRSHPSCQRASIPATLFLKTHRMKSDKTRICKDTPHLFFFFPSFLSGGLSVRRDLFLLSFPIFWKQTCSLAETGIG